MAVFALITLVAAGDAHAAARICFGAPDRCFHPSDIPAEYADGLRNHPTTRTSPFSPCCQSCERADACSNSRLEELVFLKYFLPHLLPAPKDQPRTYLEIGANDGIHASNTLHLSHCLGWAGLLIEAHPKLHAAVLDNRPGTIAINSAICANHSAVRFTAAPGHGGSMLNKATLQPLAAPARGGDASTSVLLSQGTIEVPCGPMQYYFDLLRLTHITFFSLDVEGAELHVLRSIAWDRMGVAVLVVEEKDTASNRQKNAAVAHVLKHEARMRLAYRHCVLKALCDSYWANPDLVDMAALATSTEALKAAPIQDRMQSHVIPNDKRCVAAASSPG